MLVFFLTVFPLLYPLFFPSLVRSSAMVLLGCSTAAFLSIFLPSWACILCEVCLVTALTLVKATRRNIASALPAAYILSSLSLCQTSWIAAVISLCASILSIFMKGKRNIFTTLFSSLLFSYLVSRMYYLGIPVAVLSFALLSLLGIFLQPGGKG